MPRTTSTQITSAFSRVRRQARELLVGLGRELRSKEADPTSQERRIATLSLNGPVGDRWS
jgi:hypothetical protein